MSAIINYFINLPFGIRVAIVLFFAIFVIWKLLGSSIFGILSIIPFLFRIIFLGLYVLIQEVLHTLHKRIGWIFVTADREFVNVGKGIDEGIGIWHKKWKTASKPKWKSCFWAYIIGCVIIIVPSYLKTDNKIIKAGESGFLLCEEIFQKQIAKSEWYDPQKEILLGEGLFKASVAENVQKRGFETALMVAGLNSSLLVRDIPEVENSVVLDRLYNDDLVTWNGEIAYSYVENRVKPWAKITMQNGTTGWSRMDYLYPAQYEGVIYSVTYSRNADN